MISRPQILNLRSRNQASKSTWLRVTRVFFFISQLRRPMSSNLHRFVILCICWDTPSEKTGLWQTKTVIGTILMCYWWIGLDSIINNWCILRASIESHPTCFSWFEPLKWTVDINKIYPLTFFSCWKKPHPKSLERNNTTHLSSTWNLTLGKKCVELGRFVFVNYLVIL